MTAAFKKVVQAIAVAALICFGGTAMAKEGAGTLKAFFIYPSDVVTSPPSLQALCPAIGAQSIAAATIATDVIVSLAGKVAESLIDATAARTQPEATTLDTTIPIAGFYNEKGEVAANGGCLIFHNADQDDLADASIVASLLLVPSFDRSAFHFEVFAWKFNSYLKPRTSRWLQQDDVRDFALKIEFLSPSSSGLGTRSVFVEQLYTGVSKESLATALVKGHRLPWLAAPAKPTNLPGANAAPAAIGRYLPLNVRVTMVETTRPNQFAHWVQEIAKEKRTDIASAVRDAVRRSLDDTVAATDRAKLVDAAGIAYSAYKTAWDEAATAKASRPQDPQAAAGSAAADKYLADLQAWKAALTVRVQTIATKRTLARTAFAAAELDWPGDFPSIAVP